MLVAFNLTRALHRSMDVLVDLLPRSIVRRNYQRLLWLAQILACNLRDALVTIADLMNAALRA